MDRPRPDDLIEVAEHSVATLAPLVGGDWSLPAGGLEWTCRQTLEHLCALAYGPQLATRATSFEPLALTVDPNAPLERLLATVHAMALTLAEVARGAPPEARAFHPAGMADRSGFVAMGMDELLVHTHDIAGSLGAGFGPEDRLVRLVLDRLFPWWPRDADPWAALLWVNGRAPLPGHPRLGAEWLWHCAPLEEWDGTVPRWDPVEQRPA